MVVDGLEEPKGELRRRFLGEDTCCGRVDDGEGRCCRGWAVDGSGGWDPGDNAAGAVAVVFLVLVVVVVGDAGLGGEMGWDVMVEGRSEVDGVGADSWSELARSTAGWNKPDNRETVCCERVGDQLATERSN